MLRRQQRQLLHHLLRWLVSVYWANLGHSVRVCTEIWKIHWETVVAVLVLETFPRKLCRRHRDIDTGILDENIHYTALLQNTAVRSRR